MFDAQIPQPWTFASRVYEATAGVLQVWYLVVGRVRRTEVLVMGLIRVFAFDGSPRGQVEGIPMQTNLDSNNPISHMMFVALYYHYYLDS